MQKSFKTVYFSSLYDTCILCIFMLLCHSYVKKPHIMSKRDHTMNTSTSKQYNEILPWWPNIQLCFPALTLKLLVLLNSEIAKKKYSVFWIWGDLRRFSWKSTFFEKIRGDLRNFKFEEIWGDLRWCDNPVINAIKYYWTAWWKLTH